MILNAVSSERTAILKQYFKDPGHCFQIISTFSPNIVTSNIFVY